MLRAVRCAKSSALPLRWACKERWCWGLRVVPGGGGTGPSGTRRLGATVAAMANKTFFMDPFGLRQVVCACVSLYVCVCVCVVCVCVCVCACVWHPHPRDSCPATSLSSGVEY